MKTKLASLAVAAFIAVSFGAQAQAASAVSGASAGLSTARAAAIAHDAQVQTVDSRRDRWRRDRWDRHEWRRDRDRDWGRYRRHERRHYHSRPSIYFEFGVPSYRYYTPSYRYVPTYRYVPAPSYRRVLSVSHYRWCHLQYRSYRQYDNTYQPYHGPRQQCISPYY